MTERFSADAVWRGVADAVADVIPPEAQAHLAAAQHELLRAAVAVIRHHSSRPDGGRDADDLGSEPASKGRAAPSARRAPKRSRPLRRPTPINVD